MDEIQEYCVICEQACCGDGVPRLAECEPGEGDVYLKKDIATIIAEREANAARINMLEKTMEGEHIDHANCIHDMLLRGDKFMAERDRLRELLPELRDCVCECLNDAENAPCPREARIKFYRDLLRQCDELMNEQAHQNI